MDNTNTQNDALPDLVDGENFELNLYSAEEEAKRHVFPVFAEDLYIAEISDVQKVQQKKYQSEELEDKLEVTFNLLRTVEGNPVLYSNGETADRTRIKHWFSLERTGYNLKTGEALPTRCFLTAALNIDVKSEKLSIKQADLLGKKIKIFVTVGTKADKVTPKNVCDKFSPVKVSAPTPVAA